MPKMKPCEVRCGNPSQYEAEREESDRRRGVGCDIPGKVKSELQKDLWTRKSERKIRNRAPNTSKAIKWLNYFSRRAIKRYSTFPH